MKLEAHTENNLLNNRAMDWINIKDFSFNNTFEINRYYFLYDNEAKLTAKSPQGEVTTIQISPEVAMYKGGGKFINNNLEVLLIEDFTHICSFELPSDGVV